MRLEEHRHGAVSRIEAHLADELHAVEVRGVRVEIHLVNNLRRGLLWRRRQRGGGGGPGGGTVETSLMRRPLAFVSALFFCLLPT